MKKKWVYISSDPKEVQQLHEQLKVHPIISQLLIQRGIKTFDEAKSFFRPNIQQLHDPFLMQNMDKAVQRIIKAMDNRQKILLYGDYDVDGTTCVALMYSFLSRIYSTKYLDYYIPDRYKEGYGISYKGIEYAKENGIELIIAMDCGIRAIDPISLANKYGIDTIICDHHLPSEELPNAVAILDPKQKNCNYPYKELSGCGVVFKLVQAIAQQQNYKDETWNDFFDLLVISIGSDIVQITGENRILAWLGLQQINQKKARLGVQALIEKSNKKYPISVSDLVFGGGPMLNAAGRISSAKEAVQLLLSENKEEAQEIAESLHLKNQERREHEQRITKEASEMWEATDDYKNKKSIVLFQSNWHKGVIGISASKMVDKYHRPTIILTASNHLAVGSARSIPHFDIHQAITECSHLLTNFGGHKYAAGLSIKKENIKPFIKQFESIAQQHISPKDLQAEIPIATELHFNEITTSFWNILKQFAPFGPGNRRPIFCSKNVKDGGYSRIVKENHLKLSVQQEGTTMQEGMAFNMAHLYSVIANGSFDVCYVLEENHWNGKSNLEINVKDIH